VKYLFLKDLKVIVLFEIAKLCTFATLDLLLPNTINEPSMVKSVFSRFDNARPKKYPKS
jgi:hypothetical protein